MKTFQKVLLSCFCGIMFGTCMALSFFAIRGFGIVFGVPEEIMSPVNVITGNDEEYVSDTVTKPEETPEIIQTSYVATEVETDVTAVVEDVMPSVVSITNNYSYRTYYGTEEGVGSGSGIIIGENDTEYLIVTNYHVIENNMELIVTFVDGTNAYAQLKGMDPSRDLAVIAIAIEDLDVSTIDSIAIARMGNSDTLKVGEPVIAIGNSLGYGQSVTTGVVSAINRELSVGNVNGTFIQTDAAINPGNSGGALLNIQGEVIGINSSKIGGSSVEGMGYAIPISAAQPIIDEMSLRETRTRLPEDEQGYLGISGTTSTQQDAEEYGYPEGVYIVKVYENAAADIAGIEQGDFIVSFEGESIKSMDMLQNIMSYYGIGERVTVGILRPVEDGYEELMIDIVLGSRADFG